MKSTDVLALIFQRQLVIEFVDARFTGWIRLGTEIFDRATRVVLP
jgi:hypothetical protein